VSRALVYCAGGGIGDSLLASVVARALHSRFDAVDALTLPGHAQTLQRVPDVDDVLADDGGDESRLARRLRERGYDACVVTWATARTARVAQLSGIPVRVGQARRLYSSRFTHRVTVRSELGDVTTHWSDILLDYARAIGCDTDDKQPRFVLRDEDRDAASQFMRKHELERGRYIVLHPTCSVSPRRPQWPLHGWIGLARQLRNGRGTRLAISGGPADRPIVEPLLAATKAAPMAGELSIGGTAGVLQAAQAAIIMHSGPMHIAAALGTPTVGIFPLQCDFPDRWRPIGDRVALVRASYPCRAGERMETCPDYACVENLDAPRVLAALNSLLR
jgi:ADP-heptose:LPS heptosyltransferase